MHITMRIESAFADIGQGMRTVIGVSVALAITAGLAIASPLLLIALLRPDGMGMGDVKLVAVMGLFIGWQAWTALLTGLLLAGLAGLLISLGTGSRPSRVALPLAPFLAAGTLPVLVVAL